ncbi:hypothetical protein [Mucilaginibacter sp.]|uniref:hypothetical protein n=1 Tax=Mucilaginibacter sp. TaxID=1882438 RepID=UPI0035BBAB2A
MRGYLNVPANVYCERCKYCGSKPVIAITINSDYTVKCPTDDSHYHTKAGLIDIDDWNIHNTQLYDTDRDEQQLRRA